VATAELAAFTMLMVGGVSLGLGRLMAARPWLWRGVLVTGLVLIGLPPSIHGLGWILLRSHLPFDLAALPRAFEPAALLSLRWSLVASHFAALAWQAVPTSALDAMRLLGVPTHRRWWLMIWPVLRSRVLPLAVIVSLVCLGDATAVVLVQPPGWATYATRLFSIMDNAPEKQVAAMCLTYLAVPSLLAALWLAAPSFGRVSPTPTKP